MAKPKSFDLEAMTITSVGAGDIDEGRVSVVEAAALWAGEEPSLEPSSASPVVATFVGMWSEGLRGSAKAHRQALKRFVPRLAVSAAPDLEEARAWMIADWLARRCVPTLLDAVAVAEAGHLGARLRALAALNAKARGPVATGMLEEIETLLEHHHRRLRPDGYLPPELRWGSVAARFGVVAAWNVLLFESDDAEFLPQIARQGKVIAELSMGLIAEPSARIEFISRSTVMPVLPGGSAVPGASWVNRVALERNRIGPQVYAAGVQSIDAACRDLIQSTTDLVDRLLVESERR